MSSTPEPVYLPKTRPPERSITASGRTQMTAWATVVLGGIILADNVLELGGMVPEARELTAGLMAVLVILHGVCLAWERGKVDDAAGLRLPRWPLWALPFVLWLGYGWWTDGQAPWASRETFFLAVQAWLLCWVVAATPGGRVLSWAWLLVLGAVASLAFVTAAAMQRGSHILWLPLGRVLPEAWAGRWTGTLPTPGAFGGLMVLAAGPLLVMAFSRRLGVEWRIVVGYVGMMLLLGALGSEALGAWMGVAFMFLLLPLLVGITSTQRQVAWGMVMMLLGGFAFLLVVLRQFDNGTMGLFAGLQGGEPSLSEAWQTLNGAWQGNGLRGGHGAPYAELSLAAGVTGQGGGLSYGLGDWLDLATVWGLVGVVLAVTALAGLMSAAWIGWAKLPFLVLPGGAGTAPRRVRKHSPTQPSYTPESKIMLAAGLLSLSAFAVTMLTSRTLNIPAVAYALAIVAGVLARNVPQRGGSLRLEPMTRWVAGLAPALLVAAGLAGIVGPAAFADGKLDQATRRLQEIAARPNTVQKDQALISDAEDELRKANGANPKSARIWTETAWLHLEQSLFDPAGFDAFSQQAEEAAGRAVEIAPEATKPRVTLAMAYLINNRLSEAELQVRRALDIAPNNPLVQYYAVAVLALEPASRTTAKQLVEMVEDGTYPMEHVQRVKAAYQWGVTSKVSLDGERQRPLPPRYVPPAPWPPLTGLNQEEAAAQAPQPLSVKPEKLMSGKPGSAPPGKGPTWSSGPGNATTMP